MKTTTENLTDQLDFAMTYAAGIDQIRKNEFDPSVIQGVIATLLMQAGYDKVQSYAASILMNMLSFTTITVHEEINVALNSLVNVAGKHIDEGTIPEYVIEQTKASLAAEH